MFMNLSWLEDFLALAESGNFSRAAERRHMTQPAFSRRIRAFEDWLGVALFDRGSHPVTLPRSLIVDELKQRRLIEAGPINWRIDVEIRLFRRTSKEPAAAEALWTAAASGSNRLYRGGTRGERAGRPQERSDA